MLKDAPKRTAAHSKGGGSKGSKREPLPNAPPTLASIHISKKESSRSQELAAVPEAEFEAALVVEPGKELNHNRVVSQVKEKRQKNDRKQKRTEAAKDCKHDEKIIMGDFRKLPLQSPINKRILSP